MDCGKINPISGFLMSDFRISLAQGYQHQEIGHQTSCIVYIGYLCSKIDFKFYSWQNKVNGNVLFAIGRKVR